MMPALPAVVEALALRAAREGPQPVPAPLLRQIADALADLSHIAGHGCPWCQRIAREGRAAVVVAARERGTAAAVAPDSRRGTAGTQQGVIS